MSVDEITVGRIVTQAIAGRPDMAVAETIAGMTVAEAITRLRQVVAERGPLDVEGGLHPQHPAR